jgi:hypothetical protein
VVWQSYRSSFEFACERHVARMWWWLVLFVWLAHSNDLGTDHTLAVLLRSWSLVN